MSKETNNFLDKIVINQKKYNFFSLDKASTKTWLRLKKLPFTYRILLENLLRQKKMTIKL